MLLVGARLLSCPADTLEVYQAASTDRNPITLGEVEQTWRDYFTEHPFFTTAGTPITGHRPIKFSQPPSPRQFGLHLRREEQCIRQFRCKNSVSPRMDMQKQCLEMVLISSCATILIGSNSVEGTVLFSCGADPGRICKNSRSWT